MKTVPLEFDVMPLTTRVSKASLDAAAASATVCVHTVRLFSWYTALRETPNPREKTSQIPIPDHTGFIPLSTRTFLKKGVKFSCAGASGRVAGAMGKKRTASDDATESARKKKKGGRPLTPAVFASPATANKTRDKPVTSVAAAFGLPERAKKDKPSLLRDGSDGGLIKWRCHTDGAEGEALVDQELAKHGEVLYTIFDSEKKATLLAKGTAVDKYYVDDKDTSKVVTADHPDHRVWTRANQLKIQFEGEESPTWVTAHHVKAVAAPTTASPAAASPATAAPAAAPTAAPSPAPAAAPGVDAGDGWRATLEDGGAEEEEGEDKAEGATAHAEGDAAGNAVEGGAADAVRGGGIQAAGAARQRFKRPEGAKGHTWSPDMLTDFPWLRTFPDMLESEWEQRPNEAPEYIFCVGCYNYPSVGRAGVLTRKTKHAIRRDKCKEHQGVVGRPDPSHARAMVRWNAAHPPEPEPSAMVPVPPAAAAATAAPLASLVRTVVVVALTKTAVSLIPKFVDLQRANGAAILGKGEVSKGEASTVQQLLDAAAQVLRRRQDARLRAAGMLSTMGDGSNDRKTTEQEVMHLRYPVVKGPINESLQGLRFTTEYFDLREVDVSYSTDSKSFDARAILRSTYHRSFLDRELASLPKPTLVEKDGEEEPEISPRPQSLGADRARRAAAVPTPAPALAAIPPAPMSLKIHNLTIGRSPDQLYPFGLVSTSLDGASVNMGHKSGVVALIKQEVPHVLGIHATAHVCATPPCPPHLAWPSAHQIVTVAVE